MTESQTSSHAAPPAASSSGATPRNSSAAHSPNAPTASTPANAPTPCDALRYRQSSFWARWRLRLTMLGMLLLPFFAWRFSDVRWAAWSFPIGVLVSIFGVTVRLWAAGWLRKHEALATDGPYSWVRHPLYAGTGLVALGQGLMSGVPLAALAFPLVWLLLYRPAIAEEEAFLCEKYPGDYQNFRQNVPALVPLSLRRSQSAAPQTQNSIPPNAADNAAQSGSFSWSQAWCNREYEGVLLNVVAFAVYGWLHFMRG